MSRAIGSPPQHLADPTAPAGVALPPPVELARTERDALLDIARIAVTTAVRAASRTALHDAVRRLAMDRAAAAFVTLTEDGELRGCIGHMDASTPVVESVVEAATWAALGDPRFPSVLASELPRIHVEVSVLGPLVLLEDPLTFRLGVDGVVVERSGRRGLLLPEVATMHDLDRVAMLATTCRKAGLPTDAWRDRGTRVFAFRTNRFGGPLVPVGG